MKSTRQFSLTLPAAHLGMVEVTQQLSDFVYILSIFCLYCRISLRFSGDSERLPGYGIGTTSCQ